MKEFVIGAGIGALITMYFMNKKHNQQSVLNQGVDGVRDNIKRFIEQSGIEGDAQKIADDLVGKNIDNSTYSNYEGDVKTVKSRRYVLS